MFDVGDSQAASRHWASIPQCPELYAGTRLVLKLLIHIQSSTVVGGMPCTSYLTYLTCCVEDYLMKAGNGLRQHLRPPPIPAGITFISKTAAREHYCLLKIFIRMIRSGRQVGTYRYLKYVCTVLCSSRAFQEYKTCSMIFITCVYLM